MSHTVCLIGPGHIASNPRLVKEADALHEAGYRVRVVSGTSHPLVDALDESLIATRKWHVTRVKVGSKWRRFPDTLRQKISRRIADTGRGSTTTIAWAESAITGRLLKAGLREPADLYIGHYLPGLYVARYAAMKHGAAYGFDIEDSHVDELPDTAKFAGRRISRERLERELLRECKHLTASSPMITTRYLERYNAKATTVLNVFPLSESPKTNETTDYINKDGPPSLYWFSQTIGPGRGLESIVAAMGMMSLKTKLHLRGIIASGYRETLESLAKDAGVEGSIQWHSPGNPDDMALMSASYDVGLGLELCEPPNRAICLTNKAFTYLLAGIPVLLSKTPQQTWLASELGKAACLVDLASPIEMASKIENLLRNRESLIECRRHAKQLAKERFNWDHEKKLFLTSVKNAIVNR